jgi:hypothetical protein
MAGDAADIGGADGMSDGAIKKRKTSARADY